MLVAVAGQNVERDLFKQVLEKLRAAPRPLSITVRAYAPVDADDEHTLESDDDDGGDDDDYSAGRSAMDALEDNSGAQAADDKTDDEAFLRDRLARYRKGMDPCEYTCVPVHLDSLHSLYRHALTGSPACRMAENFESQYSVEADESHSAQLAAYRAVLSLLFFGGHGTNAVSGRHSRTRPPRPAYECGILQRGVCVYDGKRSR